MTSPSNGSPCCLIPKNQRPVVIKASNPLIPLFLGVSKQEHLQFILGWPVFTSELCKSKPIKHGLQQRLLLAGRTKRSSLSGIRIWMHTGSLLHRLRSSEFPVALVPQPHQKGVPHNGGRGHHLWIPLNPNAAEQLVMDIVPTFDTLADIAR